MSAWKGGARFKPIANLLILPPVLTQRNKPEAKRNLFDLITLIFLLPRLREHHSPQIVKGWRSSTIIALVLYSMIIYHVNSWPASGGFLQHLPILCQRHLVYYIILPLILLFYLALRVIPSYRRGRLVYVLTCGQSTLVAQIRWTLHHILSMEHHDVHSINNLIRKKYSP